MSQRSKKNPQDFTLFIECKVFFESEFIGFEVYCFVITDGFSILGNK